MHHFSILELASPSFLKKVSKDKGISEEKVKDMPQEDYLLVSKRFPIFAVADGVSLEFSPDGSYPRPSPAGDVSRITCEELVSHAESRYEDFTESDLRRMFESASTAVGEYNSRHGRRKETSDFWYHDLFAATVAFAVCKEKVFYWGSICDSYVFHVRADGTRVLKSPECWPARSENLPSNWETIPIVERRKTLRRTYRNGLGRRGERIGYGVLTGEKAAATYLNTGSFAVSHDDLVVLCTDGFEQYLELPEFIALLRMPPENRGEKIRKLSEKKIKENRSAFGHERSLIAVIV